jgi:Ring finger domain
MSIPNQTQSILQYLSSQQTKRLLKVYSEEYYILDFDISQHTKINISISGSTKSVYTITINLQTNKISCNCPDSISHASKHNCICKHCCFTILKIGKLYDPNIINNKTLSNDNITYIISRLQHFSSIEELVNTDLQTKYKNIKLNNSSTPQHTEEKKTIFDSTTNKVFTDDDECPICYDLLSNGDVKSCPTCHNYIHTSCITKWLQNKSTCVLCRSDIWKTYFKDHSTTTNTNKNSNYIQL